MNPLGEKYLRKEALPTIFCPGCGHGTVLNATLRMLDKVGLDDFLFVSGIGCSSWLPVFIKADVLHTLHGRAVAVATGLKITQPDKKVMVFNGDGDCLAIGGNHLIHAARRNIDITVVTLNNYIYGMTGGQASPGTPLNGKTKTSPYGSNEPPFDSVKLAIGAGGELRGQGNHRIAGAHHQDPGKSRRPQGVLLRGDHQPVPHPGGPQHLWQGRARGHPGHHPPERRVQEGRRITARPVPHRHHPPRRDGPRLCLCDRLGF